MAYNGYPVTYPQFFYPQIPQLQMATQTQAQMQQTGILWVSSEAEAQSYPVAPNNAVALWDSTRPAIYLKQADASGKPTVKAYDLKERAETASGSNSSSRQENNATEDLKSEIEALWTAVNDIRGKIDTVKRNARKKEATEDE